MAAIYQADVWCDGCAGIIKDRISEDLWAGRLKNAVCPDGTPVVEFESQQVLDDYLRNMDERYYDSGDYPKYCDYEEECDIPQHCAAQWDCVNAIVMSDGDKVGYFFENSLTMEGEEYVRNVVWEDRALGYTGSVACEIWANFYTWIDYGPRDFCATCGEFDYLDEFSECSVCSEDLFCSGMDYDLGCTD